MSTPGLNDWVWVEVMLVQALIGAISDNFRQVALCYKDNRWSVEVVLGNENDEDREEISDIVDQFGAYLEDIKGRLSGAAYTRAISQIQVSKAALSFVQSESQRLVFRRKEG